MKTNGKKILKNILRITVLAFVGFAVGVLVYNFNAKRLAGDKMPMPLGFNASVVLSGSMEPELSVNDLIIIKKTEKLYTGQVVVFQDRNSLVVHRIESIDGDWVVTKGDANNTADAPVKRSDIKGEVVLAVPYVGIVIDVVKSPVVVIILIALALFLLERSYRKEKQEKKSELNDIKDEIRGLLEELKSQEAEAPSAADEQGEENKE